MLNVMSKSALNTKIHAMRRTTLHNEDYKALIQMQSVSEVSEYLKENTRYGLVLKNINPLTVHRGELEDLLKSLVAMDTASLLPYFDISSKFFTEAVSDETSVDMLKVLINLILIGRGEQFPYPKQELKIGKAVINTEHLLEADNFNELADMLRDTEFYKVLSPFKNNKEMQKSFYIDIALDNFVAVRVDKYARKYLSPSDAALAKATYGAEYDLRNLTCILRAKLRFDTSKEQIYAFIVPVYHKLKKETITELVNSGSYEEAIGIIKAKTPYGNAFDANDRFMEKRTNEYLFNLHRKLLKQYPYSVQCARGYIAQRKFEIKNIVSIIEGIRYNLTPTQISDYLIGQMEDEL